MDRIEADLFSMQDLSYKQFHQRLIPTVDPNTVIGVRTPQLRAYAKGIFGTPIAHAFLQELPHRYYDENNLHGFLLEQIRDFDACMQGLDAFLPQIDNWATCDLLRPKCFSRNRNRLLPYITRWLKDPHPYTVRFAIEMLLIHFLDDAFDPAYPEMVASVRSEEYYVNMIIAWYFATALAKQYDSVLFYLTEHRLSPWIHGKTVQKAIESNRISPERKACLRNLRG